MASIQSQKRALRKTISAALRSLSPNDIQLQSHAVTQSVLTNPVFLRSQHISCYLSMPASEVDTTLLVKEIIRAGKILYVPKLDLSGTMRMDMLRVEGEADLDSCIPGLWGIKEPASQLNGKARPNVTDPGQDLDLILVPGVAFDRTLQRLGHGKGYYDNFVRDYIASTGRNRPILVALALREQILERGRIPTIRDHDWEMDYIVSPDEVLGTREV